MPKPTPLGPNCLPWQLRQKISPSLSASVVESSPFLHTEQLKQPCRPRRVARNRVGMFRGGAKRTVGDQVLLGPPQKVNPPLAYLLVPRLACADRLLVEVDLFSAAAAQVRPAEARARSGRLGRAAAGPSACTGTGTCARHTHEKR